MFKFMFARKVVAAMLAAGLGSVSLWQTIISFDSDSHVKQGFWLFCTIGAFLVFCGLVLNGWYSEWKRAEILEDKRPTAHVSSHFKGNLTWLVIENSGSHDAKFGANITLFGIRLNPEDDNMSYDAKWKDMQDTPLRPIAPNQKSIVNIAQTKGCDLNKNEGIQLFTAFETKQGIVPFGSTMKCEVQITSVPQLKQQFVKRYVLRIDPETHQWTAFEEEHDDGKRSL